MNLANGALFFRQRDRAGRAVLAALHGHRSASAWSSGRRSAARISPARPRIGLALSLLGTYAASLGNMVTVRHKQRGHSRASRATPSAWLWHAVHPAARAGARHPLRASRPMPAIWSRCSISRFFASVIGFGAYLRPCRALGADRAAYTGVLFPIVALAVSTLLEGFTWTWLGGRSACCWCWPAICWCSRAGRRAGCRHFAVASGRPSGN